MQIVRSSIGFGIVPDSVQGSFISEFAAGVHAWLPVSAVLLAMAFANVSPNQLAAARECGATPLARRDPP
jgi:ABC-type spermidine/putrescine transport system permease subunit II